MSHPDELSIERLSIGDVASLLGVSVDNLSSDARQLGTLVELTEEFIEKHGEEWITQHSGVILDQWETMLSLGI